MQTFDANVSGSNNYVVERRKELEALMCATWFKLSVEDNHWLDLNQMILW